MLKQKDYKDIYKMLRTLHDAHYYETGVRLNMHDEERLNILMALVGIEAN
jgi:hypothetical protein